ncbi:MAG: hypothetical protein DI628_05620 [Blastochloris viridis]|uniref:Uncharacterized protein n=1 Tax=Blastochloris viridis TaxID=1079 RepID=A0A6N4R7P7_BLAVI|nr:MAG: hypothetical protein DI628_05620 [Blastochloris viridis]
MFGKILYVIVFLLISYGLHMAYAFQLEKAFLPFLGSLAFVMALISVLIDQALFVGQPITAHHYRIMIWFMIFAAVTIVPSDMPVLGYLSAVTIVVLGMLYLARVLQEDDPDEDLA